MPREWDPAWEADNEDELMIILDTEQEPSSGVAARSRDSSQHSNHSTGYTHLDEFERKLAEMEDEAEQVLEYVYSIVSLKFIVLSDRRPSKHGSRTR